MPNYLNMDTLRYQLFDVHGLEQLLQYERFADFDEDALQIFLDAVKDYSDQELYPCFREMDEQPAHFKDGKIITHPRLESILRKGGELGLIGSSFDYDHGGIQLPSMAFTSAYYIMDAANNHVPGYLGSQAGLQS
jgi:alkylation response protein AidB-like acyl-CoA dehydrogenase